MASEFDTLHRLRSIVRKVKAVYANNVILGNDSHEIMDELNEVESDLARVIDDYQGREYRKFNVSRERNGK